METFEHRGTTYTFTDAGLATPALQRRYQRAGWSDPYTEAPDEGQVALCLDWLRRYARHRKTANTSIGSYGLKHAVERWAGTYISNGAFIEAARHVGAGIVPVGPLSPNAWFRLAYDRAALGWAPRPDWRRSNRPTVRGGTVWHVNRS